MKLKLILASLLILSVVAKTPQKLTHFVQELDKEISSIVQNFKDSYCKKAFDGLKEKKFPLSLHRLLKLFDKIQRNQRCENKPDQLKLFKKIYCAGTLQAISFRLRHVQRLIKEKRLDAAFDELNKEFHTLSFHQNCFRKIVGKIKFLMGEILENFEKKILPKKMCEKKDQEEFEKKLELGYQHLTRMSSTEASGKSFEEDIEKMFEKAISERKKGDDKSIEKKQAVTEAKPAQKVEQKVEIAEKPKAEPVPVKEEKKPACNHDIASSNAKQIAEKQISEIKKPEKENNEKVDHELESTYELAEEKTHKNCPFKFKKHCMDFDKEEKESEEYKKKTEEAAKKQTLKSNEEAVDGKEI